MAKLLRFVTVEELNRKLFERTINEYMELGYKVINCSVSGYSMTKYVAFLALIN